MPSQILTPRQRDEFIERLAEFRREEREMATHALTAQGYEPVSFLIAELHAAPSIAQWKFSAGRAVRNLATYGGELTLFLLLEVVGGFLTNGNGGRGWGFGASNSERGEAPVYSEEMRHRKRVGRILRALAGCEDLRVIGPLCERLNEADEDSQWRAQLALKSLLPRLRPADSDLLNSAQKMRMYHLLNSHDAQTCIAALQAVGNVGDQRALPQIQMLTHSANLDIRRAALAALPALAERDRREQESQTLLRGASAPNTDGNVLLRPAQPARAVNPNELLRAADSADATQNPKSKTQNQEINPHA